MNALEKLRQMAEKQAAGVPHRTEAGTKLGEELAKSGVRFASQPGGLDDVHATAMKLLQDCVRSDDQGRPVLQEGGPYDGCWLESTGTINTEVLARFGPETAESTFGKFAELQRDDGLLPYKVTREGGVFRQIQLVTPPARSVWNHYRLNGASGGAGRDFLARMYEALSRYDDWLMAHRNTRGTGCIEAFCTFDTGHDLSSRFWHIPDTPHEGDPARYDPNNPFLPLLAPDLTASVICSRKYLARMAEELGRSDEAVAWTRKADDMLASLQAHCFHEEDGFYYDVDAEGRFVRIQSDVLLRVLASEVGDDAFFADALSRYLLNTRKFFAKYPFASIAMDDPRFDPFSHYNTWGGPTNFLSLIRTPHAFEAHGRHVELTWIMRPIMSAMADMERFGQVISPWTGEEGYTEVYSPALLCVLDYIERMCGIVPTPEGELWFTGLVPGTRDHGANLGDETAYSRVIDGVRFELHNTKSGSAVYRDGQLQFQFPHGLRAVTDRDGRLRKWVGMTLQPVEGVVAAGGKEQAVRIAGNEVWALSGDGGAGAEAFERVFAPGVVLPVHG